MLKSRGKNSTSFLNSRKAKRVLSAFYFWIVASKFQEMGGVLDFVPCNFIFFPCNCFFVRWNFYFLGRFFDYMQWFLHKSAQFSSERREIPKKQGDFLRKHQEVAKFKSAENRLFPTNSFGVANGVLNSGVKMTKVFLVLKVCASFSFQFPVSIHWTFQANERFWLSHILIHQIRQSINLSIHYKLRFIKYFKLSNKR